MDADSRDAARERVRQAEARFQARKALTEREQREALAERDGVIREAHIDGGLSTREIAPLVSLSHQRVGQIVRGTGGASTGTTGGRVRKIVPDEA